MNYQTSSPEYTALKESCNKAIDQFIKLHPEEVVVTSTEDGKTQITLFYSKTRDAKMKEIADRVMNTLNEMVDNFDIKDTKVFTRDKDEFISAMSDIDIVDTVNDLMDTVQLDNNTKKDIRAKLQTCLLAAKIYAKYYLHLLSTGVEGIDDININDTKDLDKYLEYIKADFYNYVKSDNFNSQIDKRGIRAIPWM